MIPGHRTGIATPDDRVPGGNFRHWAELGMGGGLLCRGVGVHKWVALGCWCWVWVFWLAVADLHLLLYLLYYLLYITD